ncbi:protein HEAT INTOLERANT 4-like isoform X1 [Olea europaea var. sylvestris]|uniref:protein HEAT INTOLERANT 4-like isoform X1 n=1 Tax=Olea europaea var. sylvestris TaxID=158386 RepID=UPI000C1CF45C|nr:protein HEAT INTOLERANT 4-like isoform X1 [Olea europaea var. sylvestris]
MRRGTKRKTTHKDAAPTQPDEEPNSGPSQSFQGSKDGPAEENHVEQPEREEPIQKDEVEKKVREEPTKKVAKGKAKRAKTAKPEYFSEKRNLEDLWLQVFPVGTEWDQLDTVYQYNWNFSNLEDAFEEGGELYNQKVYLFGCTEPQLVSFQGQGKVTMIPVVVAVVSPFPPSDKIGIKSVQRETEEIVPMKQMKMDWVPYIPLGNRDSQVERLKSPIFILSCIQRRAGLKHLKLERVKKFEYCLPYFYHPLQEDELEQSTVVQILFPIDPKPVFCEFDWELDELEEFTDKLIEEEELAADQKDAFKEFVKEKVREAKKANREAREARKKVLEEMSGETKAAFENMKFYKFYPMPSPDTPDVSNVKSAFINRYYGKAHKVL